MTPPWLPVKPSLPNLALRALCLTWPHLTSPNPLSTMPPVPARWVLPLDSKHKAQLKFLSFPFARLGVAVPKCEVLASYYKCPVEFSTILITCIVHLDS